MSRDPMELVGLVEGRIGQDFDGECHLTADEARQIAACIREMVEWRPIETAPRDGSLIMMVCTDPSVQSFGVKKFPHVVLGNWQDPRPGRPASDGAWNVPMCDWWIGEHDGVLTHWLPLPPAPGAEDE